MKRQLKNKLLVTCAAPLLAVVLTLLAYGLWWSFWYSQPGQPDKVVDLRARPTQPACYITFCAGLADNPLGFPGHSYVVWSKTADADPLKADAVGYITRQYNDQFLSPFLPVPGMLHSNAALYNQRNLECLTAVVDPITYEKTLQAREKWDTGSFKANEHDCLSFVTYIAGTAGLKVPAQRCLYPQDQVRALKALNNTTTTAAGSILEANHGAR